MRLSHLTSLALLSGAFLLVGCSANVGSGGSSSSTSYSDIVTSSMTSSRTSSVAISGVTGLSEELRERGLTVSAATAMTGDDILFDDTTAASIITVNDQSIQVFEFASIDTAAVQAGTVSRNGNTIRDEDISWVGMPHFYRSGNVIVLYLGNNPAIMTPLSDITGGAFAGTGLSSTGSSSATPL